MSQSCGYLTWLEIIGSPLCRKVTGGAKDFLSGGAVKLPFVSPIKAQVVKEVGNRFRHESAHFIVIEASNSALKVA
jgi:hypothetical protein